MSITLKPFTQVNITIAYIRNGVLYSTNVPSLMSTSIYNGKQIFELSEKVNSDRDIHEPCHVLGLMRGIGCEYLATWQPNCMTVDTRIVSYTFSLTTHLTTEQTRISGSGTAMLVF